MHGGVYDDVTRDLVAYPRWLACHFVRLLAKVTGLRMADPVKVAAAEDDGALRRGFCGAAFLPWSTRAELPNRQLENRSILEHLAALDGVATGQAVSLRP